MCTEYNLTGVLVATKDKQGVKACTIPEVGAIPRVLFGCCWGVVGVLLRDLVGMQRRARTSAPSARELTWNSNRAFLLLSVVC